MKKSFVKFIIRLSIMILLTGRRIKGLSKGLCVAAIVALHALRIYLCK